MARSHRRGKGDVLPDCAGEWIDADRERLRQRASTGWHSHPGPAIALIKNGELTLYSSDDPTCTGRPFGAGQGFVDSGQGHVHIARNLTSQNTEVWVTYLDVPPGRSVRVDAADPGNCVF